MHRPQTSKILSIFLSLCLLITCIPFSASAAVTPIIPIEPPDTPTLPNCVSWSNTTVVTTTTVTIGLGETKSFAQLGLSAFACYNGQYSTSFTWDTYSDKITINSNGTIYANAEGMALVTGTSTAYGSGLGQLTLILFVADSGYTDVTLVDAMDNLYKEELIYDIKAILRDQMNYSESDIRTHPTYPPSIIPRDVLMGYIASSRIAYFGGHGDVNRIYLSVYSSSTTSLYDYNLDGFPSDLFDNCELLLLDACKTASGGKTGNNLINAFLDHGVETVVGFEQSVICEEANYWVEAFFDALADHLTVAAACLAADTVVGRLDPDGNWNNSETDERGTSSHCIVGNEYKSF